MTNNQAISYVVVAMKNLGYDKKEIEHVTNEMWSEFDWKTEIEAEEKAKQILK